MVVGGHEVVSQLHDAWGSLTPPNSLVSTPSKKTYKHNMTSITKPAYCQFTAGLSPMLAYLYHLLNESFFDFLRGFRLCFLCTNSKKILPAAQPPAAGAPPQTPSE